MSKTIADLLSDSELTKARLAWATQVTDEWIAQSPDSERPQNKGFTRDELIRLADITWLGDEQFRAELTRAAEGTASPGPAMLSIIAGLYKEFGYTIGFLHHVREAMALDDGFRVVDRKTGRRERPTNKGKIVVDARMFTRLRRNPFVAAAVRQRCGDSEPTNKNVITVLEQTGKFEVPVAILKNVPGTVSRSFRAKVTA